MANIIAAAVQLNSQPDLKVSMEQAFLAVEESARQGAHLITLPENFAFLGHEKEKQQQAEQISQTVMEKIPEWAKQFGVNILAGGFPVRAESGKVYNRAMLVNSSGRIVSVYDKIHLFDVSLSDEETYRESDTVEAGNPEPVTGNIALPDQLNNGKSSLKIGLSICYDLRFPELYRRLAEKGADILTVPSAFTKPTGRAHWEVLLRARAIENTCFVIAPAQTGKHGPTRKTYGHSVIIDPWGTVLSDAGREPGIVMSEINLDVIQTVRSKLPSLSHRILK